jgi:transposase InsO family protein
MLWHERFGHLNFKYLDQHSKAEMLDGLPHIQYTDGVCQGCILGKHPEEKFNTSKVWRTLSLLELIHSDITGPFPHPLISKVKYVLTFIEDFSRYTWVYFLKLKSEVFECLKDIKHLVENQTGKRIKKLHTDNGGEYVNKDVEHVCSESSIALQHTVPYTTQQNGVAERKNKTLKEMANCILQARALPPKLWVGAINCEAYIQNRVPNKSVKGVTTYEAWSEKKPEVTHFRIFGSRAWARIPFDRREAMEAQSKECIFVGYQEGMKGYMLLDTTSNTLFVQRSVKFEEGPSQVLSEQSTPPSPSPLIAKLRKAPFDQIFIRSLNLIYMIFLINNKKLQVQSIEHDRHNILFSQQVI